MRNVILLSILLIQFIPIQTYSQVDEVQDQNVLTILTPYRDLSNTIWVSEKKTHLIPTVGSLLTRSGEPNLPYVPMLASEMPTISNNGLLYTIKLRENLVFSDGSPLTAEDVVFSYNVAMTPKIYDSVFPAPSYDEFTNFFASNSSIIEIDELTVEFHFTKAHITAMSFFLLNLVDKDRYVSDYSMCVSGDNDSCKWDTLEYAINAGPFILDNFNENSSTWTLVKNPNFYDTKTINADVIYVKTEENFITAQNMLIADQADILHYDLVYEGFLNNRSTFVSTIKDPNVKSRTYSLSTNLIGLNHLHPFYGNGSIVPDNGITSNNEIQANLIRKAMSYVVDYETYSENVELGVSTPATSIWPIDTVGYNNDLMVRNFSISTAKSLMEDAGFSYDDILDENNDGDYGDENDTSFFEINALIPNNNQYRIEYANLYSDALEQIGIKVIRHEVSLFEVFIRSFGNQNPDEVPLYDSGGYDIIFISLELPIEMSPFEANGFHSKGRCLNFPEESEIRCANPYNFANSSIDSVLENYISELDYEERIQLGKTFQQFEYENLPIIPLLYNKGMFLTSPHLKGYNAVLDYDLKQQWHNVYRDDWEVNSNPDETGAFNQTFLIIGLVTVASVGLFIVSRKVRK